MTNAGTPDPDPGPGFPHRTATSMTSPHHTPRQAAQLYRQLGWPGILTLPPRSKIPPPRGTTGRDGHDMHHGEIDRTLARRPDSNLGLRLPRGVLGIDVDAGYSGKRGDVTIRAAQEAHGPLPVSWSSTARGQGQPSRISLYQCSPEVEFPGQLAVGSTGDVELIQHHHRYAVVGPSVHPDGDTYQWYGPDGQPAGAPHLDELPWLPKAWQDALSGPPRAVLPPADRQAVAELADRLGGDSGMCPTMLAALATPPALGARHDAVAGQVLRVLRCGDRGHRGAEPAVDALRDHFLNTVSADLQRKGNPGPEFQRIVDGGLALIARSPTPAPWRHCCSALPRKAPL